MILLFLFLLNYLADSKSLLAVSKIPSSTVEVDFLAGGRWASGTCLDSCVSARVDMLLLFLSSLIMSRILTFPALLFSFETLRLWLFSELFLELNSLIVLVLWHLLIRFFSLVKFSLSSSAVLRFAKESGFSKGVSTLYFLNQLWLSACSIVSRSLSND